MSAGDVNFPSRAEVLGTKVDCIDMQDAIDLVDAAIKGNEHLTVLAVNPEKVMTARRDPATRTSLSRAGLLIPDGIGVVWAARLLTGQAIRRVPGSELMPAICELAACNGYKVFLYGAAPGVVDRACDTLLQKYPSLQIAGAQHGYIKDHEMPEFIGRIRASGAQVLFVALGSPRQELWIERFSPQLEVNVYQGVGGTFNVLAGEVMRAPALIRNIHLEWMYRLIKNPSRIVRQRVLPIFVIGVIWQKIRQIFSGS